MRASTYVYLVNPLQQGNGRKKDLATSHKRTQPDPSSLLPSITHLPLQNPTQANPTCQIPHTLLGTCTYTYTQQHLPTCPNPKASITNMANPKPRQAPQATNHTRPPTQVCTYIHTIQTQNAKPQLQTSNPFPSKRHVPQTSAGTPGF